MDWNILILVGPFLVLGAVEVYFNYQRNRRQRDADHAVQDMFLAMMEHKMTGRMPTPEEMTERRKGTTNGRGGTPVEDPRSPESPSGRGDR